jgi:uncharacterized tellurite resistance protein B-like protein
LAETTCNLPTGWPVELGMLGALRNLIADLTGDRKSAGGLDDDGYRVAAAALLVHAAATDDHFSAAERRTLLALLRQRFELDDVAAQELIDQAIVEQRDAVDLYRFIRVLNRHFDHAGRCRMVEMLWQIVHADGEVSPYEDNLVWRVADLLGVDSHERIALRRRIADMTRPGGRT